MSNVLTQTIVYVILLFAGYGFKKAGIFKVEDTDFLKKVILYLTMPAMAVNGLKDLELQPSFLWCFSGRVRYQHHSYAGGNGGYKKKISRRKGAVSF